MSDFAASLGLPVAALLALGVLVVAQLALQVTALVQLASTPAERVSMGGRKWLWALIIVFGEILGPIVWFFAGRTPEMAEEPVRRDATEESSAVADALYGTKRDAE